VVVEDHPADGAADGLSSASRPATDGPLSSEAMGKASA